MFHPDKTSAVSGHDADLHTRVLEAVRTHRDLYESELNSYVRRYLLKSKATIVIAFLLGISGLLMALKTHNWIFALTHLPSCLLFFLYGPIANRFDYFNRRAAAYCDLLCKVITIESAYVLWLYAAQGEMHLVASSSPTLVMMMVYALHTHSNMKRNLVNASITAGMLLAYIAWIDLSYLTVNSGALFIGGALGGVVNSLVMRLFRYKFYFSLQEKSMRTHAYRQLEKMLYPHQRRMIEDGRILEETMPVGHGEACVIAFDVIGSSKIKSPYARTLLQNVLKKCQGVMMENYSQSDFEANAYRIKEMGDGFLCSVGYPFKVPGVLSREAHAIKLAQRFIAVFHEEAAKFAPGERIFCSIGIASGAIESFYPHTNPKEYDLYGRPLILATRYESIRKELFNHIPASSIIVLQESVHQRLPAQVSAGFQDFELQNFRIRDDHDAKRLFFQTFDDHGHVQVRPPKLVIQAAS